MILENSLLPCLRGSQILPDTTDLMSDHEIGMDLHVLFISYLFSLLLIQKEDNYKKEKKEVLHTNGLHLDIKYIKRKMIL